MAKKNKRKVEKEDRASEKINLRDDTLKRRGESRGRRRRRSFTLAAVVLFAAISVFLIFMGWIKILAISLGLILLVFVYFIVQRRLKKYSDIKKMEDAFPDFISLMSSNLRAGMTIDRALLLSSRKEFAPLDKEITQLGKDIMTGKEINKALIDMSDRINSEEIRKTILLIVSGIRSGGNLSVLLEQVSSNMRARAFVGKRAASNVLMYVIFIFFAVAIGAPVLFGLSSILVGVLTEMASNIPSDQIVNVNVPFVFTEVNISVTFIIYFALAFIISTDILASFVLGLVSKGRERDGLKYIVPLILVSVTMFFLSRMVILRYFPGFLG